MNTSLQSEFKELLALTQNYLIQEFSPQQWIEVDRESYSYFRSFAQLKKQEAPKTEALKKPIEPQATKIYKPTEINPPQPAAQKLPPKKDLPSSQKFENNPEIKKVLEPVSVEAPNRVSKKIQSDPLPLLENHDLSDLRKIISEKFPEQKILDYPPDDTRAKIVKNGWKNKIKETKLVLLCPPHFHQHPLLTHLRHAIQVIFNTPTEISDVHLDSEKNPTLALENLDVYIQDFRQKALLWQKIKQILKPS